MERTRRLDLVRHLEYIWKGPGASTPKTILPPSNGSPPRPARSWPAGPVSSPPESAARPPTTAWTPANGYLLAHEPYLDYPTALANGVADRHCVIEGACRHLIKDRM